MIDQGFAQAVQRPIPTRAACSLQLDELNPTGAHYRRVGHEAVAEPRHPRCVSAAVRGSAAVPAASEQRVARR